MIAMCIAYTYNNVMQATIVTILHGQKCQVTEWVCFLFSEMCLPYLILVDEK